MSRFPLPPNSRSPTWNVTVILSSACSCSWKHSREWARSWMLCADTRLRKPMKAASSIEMCAMVDNVGYSKMLDYREAFVNIELLQVLVYCCTICPWRVPEARRERAFRFRQTIELVAYRGKVGLAPILGTSPGVTCTFTLLVLHLASLVSRVERRRHADTQSSCSYIRLKALNAFLKLLYAGNTSTTLVLCQHSSGQFAMIC